MVGADIKRLLIAKKIQPLPNFYPTELLNFNHQFYISETTIIILEKNTSISTNGAFGELAKERLNAAHGFDLGMTFPLMCNIARRAESRSANSMKQ